MYDSVLHVLNTAYVETGHVHTSYHLLQTAIVESRHHDDVDDKVFRRVRVADFSGGFSTSTSSTT